MGLLDGYFDPQQFQAGGGLLGRLLSLPQMHGLYRPGADDLDQAPTAPAAPPLQAKPWPGLSSDGQRSSDGQPAAPDIHSQYQALRPVLGDRNAMLATVHPEIGKALIAQAVANLQASATANVVPAGYGGPVVSGASPAPVPRRSQYAQAPLALCATGLPGCTLGAGLTLLGGVALGGGLGAVILNNQKKSPAPGNKPAAAPSDQRDGKTIDDRETNQPANDGGPAERGR